MHYKNYSELVINIRKEMPFNIPSPLLLDIMQVHIL